MFLLIDMSQLNETHLALFDENSRKDKTFEVRNRELLFCIEQMRDELRGKGEEDRVDGIMVVVGSGSFTSTRIGVVIANTWAYTHQIPLLAIQEGDIEHIQQLIPKLLSQPKGQYISATYSGEPNIGKNK